MAFVVENLTFARVPQGSVHTSFENHEPQGRALRSGGQEEQVRSD
jgi:hypothetical protein